MSLPPWQRPPNTAPPDPVTDEVRALVRLRSGNKCELCGGAAQHLHHRQLRRAGDHSAANLVHLCHLCHRRVHGHVRWSTDEGWLVSQYAEPASVPVCMGETWVRLGADGSRTAVSGPFGTVESPHSA